MTTLITAAKETKVKAKPQFVKGIVDDEKVAFYKHIHIKARVQIPFL